MNKFLLACRLFQRGTAALETIKRDYPIRELLAEKTLIYEQKQQDDTGDRLRRINSGPITKSMDFSTQMDRLQ